MPQKRKMLVMGLKRQWPTARRKRSGAGGEVVVVYWAVEYEGVRVTGNGA